MQACFEIPMLSDLNQILQAGFSTSYEDAYPPSCCIWRMYLLSVEVTPLLHKSPNIVRDGNAAEKTKQNTDAVLQVISLWLFKCTDLLSKSKVSSPFTAGTILLY